ncbi:MAG: hypothetical protein JWO67_5634 [Streptosporangiaceae bacterium]|nr:hypothetical protein [Streptosporangiaceae bacterium]
MPAPDAISDLPQRIIDALRIEVEWTVHEPDGFGLGFVAGELGVWLATRDDDRLSALHIEVRVARHVPDGPDVRKFCETRNHYGLVGRWVHDAATATVSLVADLPSFNADGPEAGLVEVWAEYVAHMIATAESAAFRSLPQLGMGGQKALTLVGGQRRKPSDRFVNRLADIVELGKDAEAAEEVMELLRQTPPVVHGRAGSSWLISHESPVIALRCLDGEVISIFAAQHPTFGWGIMIAAGQDPEKLWLDDDPELIASLNRTAVQRGGLAPGSWTQGQHVEHRMFISNTLLRAAGSPQTAHFAVSEFVTETAVQLRRSRITVEQETPALVRPAWPDDDRADVLARRDPFNDGIDNPDVAIYLDLFGRGCGITQRSFELWESRLTDDDRTDPRVAGFTKFVRARNTG